MDKNHGPRTRALHGRSKTWPTSAATSSITTPIFESATFAIRSLDDAADIISRGGETFQLGEDYVYSRGGNPTQRQLELRLADLEGASDAIVFSSGMAAITAAITSTLKSGDHAIVTESCFGDTQFLFGRTCAKFGITTTFVDTSSLSKIAEALRPTTQLIFVETPANPILKVTDLSGLARLGREARVRTVVDSTFASPCLQRPLEHGCDAVVHSLTKYINGHSDAIGGGIASHDLEFLAALRLNLFTTGAVLDPFAAFLILRGVETLHVRMDRHCASGLEVAQYLADHVGVERVYYPGLTGHPNYGVAADQMNGFGAVVAFELRGGRVAVERFLSRLELCTFAVSIGSTKSLVEYPAGMTHKIMSTDARAKAGISESLVRLSVGLEDVQDILADLDAALRP